MDFRTVSKNDPDFARKMMQKHLETKKKRNITVYDKIQANYTEPIYPQKRNLKNLNQQETKMKKMWKEQIEESLQNYKNLKNQKQVEENKIRRAMATENGILDYMEAEISKRNKFIEKCLLKQQNMRQSYIDEDARKHKHIVSHIDFNYDKDIFNHESDRYQENQRINEALTWAINEQQKEDKRYEKIKQKSEYGIYFEGNRPLKEHNPIINPKQYHIENKYIQRNLNKIR